MKAIVVTERSAGTTGMFGLGRDEAAWTCTMTPNPAPA